MSLEITGLEEIGVSTGGETKRANILAV